MKKTLYFVMFSLVMTGCKNNDGDSSPNIATQNILPTYVFDTIDSMVLDNDTPLLNASSTASWAKSGFIVQGIPRGDSVPSWWSDTILDETITTSKSWNALTAWFTIFESLENQVHDAKIFYSNFEVWLLKGNEIENAIWEKLSTVPTKWASYYEPDIVTWNGDALPDFSSGYFLFQHPSILHGGTSKLAFDGNDVLGIFVRTKAWVDSSNSNPDLLMSIGIDYYPSIESSVSKGDFADANYLPGAGGSRFIRLESEPKWFYMANIARDDLSNVEKDNIFSLRGGRHYLTVNEWKDNFPPLSFE